MIGRLGGKWVSSNLFQKWEETGHEEGEGGKEQRKGWRRCRGRKGEVARVHCGLKEPGHRVDEESEGDDKDGSSARGYGGDRVRHADVPV